MTRRIRLIPVILFLLAIPAGLLHAQEGASCNRTELEPLEFLSGEWRVESRFRLPGGRWEPSVARSSIRTTLRKCALLERFKGERNGRTYRGMALISFNQENGTLQRAWLDTGRDPITLYEGRRTGNRLVLSSEITVEGRAIRLQHVYLEITNDSFKFESRRSRDGGATWETSWEMTYTRVAG